MFILIRHGDYDESKTYKLTANGKLQAEATGEAIASLPGLPPICQVITSKMIRARETASIIARILDPIMVPVMDVELAEGVEAKRFSEVFEKYLNHDSCPKTDIIVCHANIIRCFVCT